MVNPWLALEAGADPAARIASLRRAHETFLAGGPVAPPVRPVVADSWRRSADARAAPDGTVPVELDDEALRAHRDGHPLARALPVFRELLGAIAQDGAHLLAVCDAQGRMLWVEGHPGVRRRAESMNFVVGARWDEQHAGTNAPGTALAADHAVQIFAAEHYNRRVQRWTCAAAPLHDRRTGRLLGAVDITGGDHLAHPHSLALVQATARAAEAHLAAYTPEPCTFLTALGRDEALLVVDGRRLRLGRRHSEIMVLLAHHPDGLTGDQLALLLYGEREVRPVTLRAELSRLRHLVGPLLASRPYRLRSPVDTDAATVDTALTTGGPSAALDGYPGPLLPLSDAPGVRRLRDALEARLRRSLLTCGDPEPLRQWTGTPWGEDDLEVWEALANALPPHAPGHVRARGAVRRLREVYGVAGR
ncbi:GAF domain-containing protein [Streptomyces benahoarensis]|uniref:GAF domain-containing protein n=1 Tax=Streptomyces benahoarensis TaxID=2595054 RepID=A0A553Z6A9_9ACTN|nr:GAF domain-containing protein [Streptomyces benahoarensis]TSB25119.1 GAF domain-containing protein [Streptomyces benahoarensis]TSB36969.1 GAF domain-containing protein [Streptomyces benahoarensis]